jgi:ArsR family transcriptional regulator, arsenate/arsenite/antimonite-responsive transcriptional repressor
LTEYKKAVKDNSIGIKAKTNLAHCIQGVSEMKMETKQLAKIMKALSNTNRLELYLEIKKKNEVSFETGEECFITDIIACMNIGAPTISHHLKELANAGLITTERRGKFLVAQICKKTLGAASQVLSLKGEK